MLALNNIEVVYDGVILVLKGVSLNAEEGHITTLLGANGAGKTTTLKAISGLLQTERGQVTKGSVELDGERLDRLLPFDVVKRGVVQVFEGRRVFENLTAEENLIAGAHSRSNYAEVRASIDKVYDSFPVLKERRHQSAGYLSGGEQQMLVIGRALMSEPKVILLDEPSLGLAPMVIEEIFASVALAHPDLAAEQLEDAVKRLGLRGVLIGGSINGADLSDPKFHPFWAKAEQLGVLVFIHPQGTPELDATSRLKGNGGLYNVIGNPLETTIALSHLIFEGTLDKYPGLKICGAHAGGYLPSYAARSDKMCENRPDLCKVPLKKKPSEYLRQLYFDSMVFTPEGLRHLIAEVGVGQIVMGTDHPFPWTKTSVDHILDQPGLSDADRVAMLSETAAKLLGIKSS